MEKNWLDDNWVWLLVRGILAILFGIMAMVWPGITTVALAVLWGCWALVDGVVNIVAGFQKGAAGKGWKIFFGVVSILAGLIAIVHPFDAALILTWILGIWFIVTAIFQGVGAFSSTRTQPRWMLIVTAVLSLLIGILFVARPGTGVLSIVLWLAIVAIIWGIFLIFAAFAARRLGKDIDAAAAAPA
ncbi:MAG TPA: HdeD family acid-resistance protein [Lapillicoccus sp.]|nr:HdeD family acid-resistance protein [Lapillicoccus sp.]